MTESRPVDHDQETLEALLPRLLAARLGVTPEQLLALQKGERPTFADREVSNSLLVASLVSTLGGPRQLPGAGVPGSGDPSQDDLLAFIRAPLRRLGLRIASFER